MALFGKKKGNGDGADGADSGVPQGGFSPERAQKFFEVAQVRHDTSNFPYAIQLWLNGLAQDPSSISGFEGFVKSVNAYVEDHDGKPPSKEVREIEAGLQGGGALKKYQLALFAWGRKQHDMGLAVKAAEQSASLGVKEITQFLGRIAFSLAQQDKKAKKDTFVKLMEVFEKGEAYDLAQQAGVVAREMDPSDGELDQYLKTLMAKSAIDKGGFSGEEGGFRRNIRDAGKQADLEAADRLTKTDDVKDRIIAAAEADHKERPDDPAALDKYGKALLDRGKPADELKALLLYKKAFEGMGQFRFRQKQGEIEIRIERRKIAAIKRKLQASPDDEKLQKMLADAEAGLAAKELEELKLQVENYPTDLSLKYRLGVKLYETGAHQDAITQFQSAVNDSKNRMGVLRHMAESFRALGGWEDAAISTYRQAVDLIVDDSSDEAMEVNYGLMRALQDKAKADGDTESAEEADRIAASIAMKNFGYKDIQDRRKAIKDLIAELRG